MSNNNKKQKYSIWRLGGRSVVFALAAALLLILGATGAMASNTPSVQGQPPDQGSLGTNWAVVDVPPEAQYFTIADEQPRGLPANPKLDSALAELGKAASPAEMNVLAESSGLRLAGGRVQVQLVIDPARAKEAQQVLAAAGGQITKHNDEGDILQAWLPPDGLAAVSAAEAVHYVRQPAYALEVEDEALAALTEGVAAAGAQTWHSAGLTGQGVKIAIIDAGFQGYPGLLGNDLPANVTAKTFVDFQNDSYVDNLTPHGTACAEIVHDMAPGAQLYLLQVSTDIDLGEAVDYAIAQGVDVISTSLAWLNVTPGDGTGYFDQQADEARAAGILWVTAAGNYRESHWGGAFNDMGDSTHEFADGQNVNFFGPGNGQAIAIPAGRVLRVYVRWDDWQAINQDYALLLLRWNGSEYDVVASSDDPQTGSPGQRPAEQISYVTSGSATVYGYAVVRITGTRGANLEIFTPNLPVDVRVHERSLGNLADVGGVFTVAALDVNSPYPQEFYSSEGPINGPGGTQNGGGNKPDISAYANVSTSSYGAGGFNGTSSAAPHVAGAAALVVSVRPFYTPNDIQSLLQGRAADLGNPGLDALFGYGRLLLGEPLSPVVLDEHTFVPVTLR